MIDPFFNLSHRFPCLDRRRTGHAASRLPGRLRGVAQVRIGRGERLAFHVLIVADQVSTPQQRDEATNRRYRNRRIGECLKVLDLAEGRSTGVPKILRAMRNNGSPALTFETDDDRTWFLVRLPAHPSFPPGAGDTSSEQDTEQDNHLEDNEKSLLSPHDTPQDTPQVTECVERLIVAVQRETSRARLQAALKLRDRRSFIDTYLKPAFEAGLIEMILPDKPTSRNQRYRRTSAGEALARQLTESSK